MYWHTICANAFLFLYIAKGVPQASRPGGLWMMLAGHHGNGAVADIRPVVANLHDMGAALGALPTWVGVGEVVPSCSFCGEDVEVYRPPLRKCLFGIVFGYVEAISDDDNGIDSHIIAKDKFGTNMVFDVVFDNVVDAPYNTNP